MQKQHHIIPSCMKPLERSFGRVLRRANDVFVGTTFEKDLLLQALIAKCWQQAKLCRSLSRERILSSIRFALFEVCYPCGYCEVSNARSFSCLWRKASIAILKLPFLSHHVLFESHVGFSFQQQLLELTLFTDQTNLTSFLKLSTLVSLFLFAQCSVCQLVEKSEAIRNTRFKQSLRNRLLLFLLSALLDFSKNSLD